jgi:hypothetical protein
VDKIAEGTKGAIKVTWDDGRFLLEVNIPRRLALTIAGQPSRAFRPNSPATLML